MHNMGNIVGSKLIITAYVLHPTRQIGNNRRWGMQRKRVINIRQ